MFASCLLHCVNSVLVAKVRENVKALRSSTSSFSPYYCIVSPLVVKQFEKIVKLVTSDVRF